MQWRCEMADTTQIEIKQKTKDGLVKIHPITDASAVQTTNSTTIQQELDNAVSLVAGDNITIAPASNGLVISAQGGDLSKYVPITRTVNGKALSSDITLAAADVGVNETNFPGLKKTGTVTSVAVKMNGSTKGTITSSGTINLGTVLTSHQSLANYVTSSSLTSTLANYAKLSANNTFSGTNMFKMANRTLSIRLDNYCSDANEDYIPFRCMKTGANFGIRGANETIYDLSNLKGDKGTSIYVAINDIPGDAAAGTTSSTTKSNLSNANVQVGDTIIDKYTYNGGTGELGFWKITSISGNNISCTGLGHLSIPPSSYSLPKASENVLGGVYASISFRSFNFMCADNYIICFRVGKFKQTSGSTTATASVTFASAMTFRGYNATNVYVVLTDGENQSSTNAYLSDVAVKSTSYTGFTYVAGNNEKGYIYYLAIGLW